MRKFDITQLFNPIFVYSSLILLIFYLISSFFGVLAYWREILLYILAIIMYIALQYYLIKGFILLGIWSSKAIIFYKDKLLKFPLLVEKWTLTFD
jgi:hypothetical protein